MREAKELGSAARIAFSLSDSRSGLVRSALDCRDGAERSYPQHRVFGRGGYPVVTGAQTR